MVAAGLASSLYATPGDLSFKPLDDFSQIREATRRDQRVLCPVRIEATAQFTSASKGILSFGNATDVDLVPAELQGRAISRGQKLLIEGLCLFDQRGLYLGRAPLVDNDGLHDAAERTGRAFLEAGKHPFRVQCFNQAGDFSLEVYYQRPGFARERIPDRVMWHPQVEPASGITNWIGGLVYRCFEGSWERLPEFDQLQPVKSGTVTNFDLTVASRANDVALEFAGYLELPEAGWYEFTTLSDDGSVLFLDEPLVGLHAIGTNQIIRPLRVAPGQLLSPAEAGKLAQAEGVVTFSREDMLPVEFELSRGAAHLDIEVLDPSGIAPQLFSAARIGVTGLLQSTYSVDGQRRASRMLVPTVRELEILEVPQRLWSAYPIQAIAELVRSRKVSKAPTIAHVQGILRGKAPDQAAILEDTTGRVFVESGAAMEGVGQNPVEAMGCLVLEHGQPKLRGCVIRQPGSKANGDSSVLPLLTSAAQVKNLGRDEANLGYPVKIRGVLTLVWPGSGLVLQDSTWSVYVTWPTSLGAEVPLQGEYWEIEGVTVAGFAPNVSPRRVQRLGGGDMPEPLRPTWDQLINGSLDTQYVEIQGVVCSVKNQAMVLLTHGGKLKIDLPDLTLAALRPFDNALIRIRGCLVPAKDESQLGIKLGYINLYGPSISVDEPAPADPFRLPLKHVADLQLFDRRSAALNRIKLGGQILHERQGRFFLAEGTNGFRVAAKGPVSAGVGDLIEVVGFPELDRPSPLLREGIVRKVGTAVLPSPKVVADPQVLDSRLDSRWVTMSAHLVDGHTNQVEQILELRSGNRTFLARLPNRLGLLPKLISGSHLQVTGVYAGQGGDRTIGREIDGVELLLNSPLDVAVLERPSWWTARHALVVAGTLAGVLLLAMGWIAALRRRVELRTRELRSEIALQRSTERELAEKAGQLANEIQERKQIEVVLREKQKHLETEIEERKNAEREVERTHKQLLHASRQAGMAEVATSVLHNVGNVLNSVNVSASLLAEQFQKSDPNRLRRVVSLVQDGPSEAGQLPVQAPKRQQIGEYLKLLADQWAQEQAFAQTELTSLCANVDHIKEIVTMQQAYAKTAGLSELIPPTELLEDALRMTRGALVRHQVKVEQHSAPDLPPISVDKHKALQILVNLICNAKEACDDSRRPDKHIKLGVTATESSVRFVVADNGVGIPPENLTRIFNHGFTTRKQGHGFGLHSGALAATELGGHLSAHSEGPGKGATFILELPVGRTAMGGQTSPSI